MTDPRVTDHDCGTLPRRHFTRQVETLRALARRLQQSDPAGAAACLFAASVLSTLPPDAGLSPPPTVPMPDGPDLVKGRLN